MTVESRSRLLAGLVAVVVQSAGPLGAETLTCSVSFQGYTVCQGPDGYRSTEWKWQDRTIGQDSDDNRWTTSPWRDGTITTATPGR
jgi:hypothetical protein